MPLVPDLMTTAANENKFLDTIQGSSTGSVGSVLSLVSVVLYFLTHLTKAFHTTKAASKKTKYRFLKNYFQDLPPELEKSFQAAVDLVHGVDEQLSGGPVILDHEIKLIEAQLRRYRTIFLRSNHCVRIFTDVTPHAHDVIDFSRFLTVPEQ